MADKICYQNGFQATHHICNWEVGGVHVEAISIGQVSNLTIKSKISIALINFINNILDILLLGSNF